VVAENFEFWPSRDPYKCDPSGFDSPNCKRSRRQNGDDDAQGQLLLNHFYGYAAGKNDCAGATGNVCFGKPSDSFTMSEIAPPGFQPLPGRHQSPVASASSMMNLIVFRQLRHAPFMHDKVPPWGCKRRSHQDRTRQARNRRPHTADPCSSSAYSVRKTRGSFPNDDAALKLLCLAIKNAGLRWRRAVEWPAAMS